MTSPLRFPLVCSNEVQNDFSIKTVRSTSRFYRLPVLKIYLLIVALVTTCILWIRYTALQFFYRLILKTSKTMQNQLISKQQLAPLTQEAKNLGATASAIISSNEIEVRDHLAALCNGEFKCPNYGRAASCPPNVEGPDIFRKWQEESRYSITVKIELPTSVMFSNERNSVMRLLHQIVAAVELQAIELGLKNSKGFAGGSCKELFCNDKKNCRVLAENGPCRHLESARPSMSGFGIDVTRLMESSRWSGAKAEKSNIAETEDTSWIAGLIMLA